MHPQHQISSDPSELLCPINALVGFDDDAYLPELLVVLCSLLHLMVLLLRLLDRQGTSVLLAAGLNTQFALHPNLLVDYHTPLRLA